MKEILPFTIKNLKRRKLRSYLTIIGIIVGVVAIVSLMSLSQGLREGISSEFERTGAQKITISSKYNQFGQGSEKGLNERDLSEIERIQGVRFAAGTITATSQTEFSRETRFTTVTGYNIENFEEILYQDGFELYRGRMIESRNLKEIVIGYDLFENDSFYGRNVRIGDNIRINNQNYQVIGVLKESGNRRNDRNIYMSIDNIREVTNTRGDEVDSIFVVVSDNFDIEMVGEEIENRLERFRKENDFIVTTPKKAAEDREQILSVVSIVIVGIASISLLVGGIGILNSMYTSVLERRKEIGILKAIGARREDILKIFLLESGIIGLIGGIIGTIGGFLIAFLVNLIGNYAGVTISISFGLDIILIALGFSFFLGLLAGFLPAYQASKQEAIESLREE